MKIVKKEEPNDALLVMENISNLDRYGILRLFVNIDKASYLKDKCEQAKRKAAFVGELFETRGIITDTNC
jgi:hypothetical protein